MRDKLPLKPKYNECGILNLDESHKTGSHWVAWRKRGAKCYYFDSFGNIPPPMELRKYLFPHNILYNYDTFQATNSVYCGHLSVLFLHLKRLSFTFKVCSPIR